MVVQAALRHAGGAGGEADEADVVRRRVAGRELRRGARAAPFQIAVAPEDEVAQLRAARALHLVGELRVAQRVRDARLVEGLPDFLRAQQRHGGDDHAARLQHGEIRGDHPRVVGGAQQHAVAGHEAEFADEHVGDAVHPLRELRVAERLGRRHQRWVVGALGEVAVEQLHRAIQALRIGDGVPELRPFAARRQIVADEAVDPGHARSLSARAMTTRWISDAPS